MVAVITTKHLVDLLTSKAQVDPPHRPKVDSHSERGDEQEDRQTGRGADGKAGRQATHQIRRHCRFSMVKLVPYKTRWTPWTASSYYSTTFLDTVAFSLVAIHWNSS